MEKRTVLHMNAVKRILRYVKGTINYGVVYSRDIGNICLQDTRIAILEDKQMTGRVQEECKHIDKRYHYIRECVERKEIIVKHVSSDMQRADCLTKALTTIQFERMRRLLGVMELSK
ncbi:uncharacterized protein LOC141704123 [Apium graveolens]|uniref:uncharacterized protein LOC141704123 n=1 Tax=Apium graveolens TaxID=4045 RepID=UPI003D78BBC1